MSRMYRLASRIFALGALSWVLLASAAAEALPFTATWNVVSVDAPEEPPDSPFYDCSSWAAGGLICERLWDEGLAVRPGPGTGTLPMYGDSNPAFDAFGFTSSSGDIFDVSPECLAGVYPCFGGFTPLEIAVSVDARGGVGLYVTDGFRFFVVPAFSGPVKFPADWTGIQRLGIGLYFPDDCADCRVDGGFVDLYRLKFETTPVPEPASVVLLGSGVFAMLWRKRRCTTGHD